METPRDSTAGIEVMSSFNGDITPKYEMGASYDEDDDDRDDDEAPDLKTLKSRARNREHAKRTRLRKKAVLDIMKERLLDLQNEVPWRCFP
jgi:hypothetical protein